MAGTYEIRAETVRFRYTGPRFPRPIYESFHGLAGKRDIQRSLAKWVQDIESGEWHKRQARQASARTVQDSFDSWLQRADLRRTTLKGYRNVLSKYVNPVIGKMLVQDVQTAQCQQVIDRMTGMGRAGKTAVNAHRVMTAGFNVAVRQGLRPDNPADNRKVITPSPQPPHLSVPSVDQVNLIMKGAADGPDHAAVVVAAETGLRRGELLGLRWCDIDLDRGRARVAQTVFVVDGEVRFGGPKTERSRRTIGLTPRAVTLLRRHRAAQSERRLSLGAMWHDNDLVFDRGDGGPLHPDTFSRRFHALVTRLGLKGVRLHDLRHAFATNLLGMVGTKDTSAALGHASEAFTMRVYQHLVPDANAELVVQAVAQVYGGLE